METFDEVIQYFAHKFSELDLSIRQNTTEEYKKELLELTQQFHSLPMTRIKTSNPGFNQSMFWAVSEILSEFFAMNPSLMYRYRPDIIEWSYALRPDKSAEYAYGRRWNEWNQVLNTVQTLSKRRDSKRAVMPIFMPYDTEPHRENVPCTLGYDFKIRNGQIDMTTFFRSHDFFRGMKYDNFLSSFMGQIIAMLVNANTNDDIHPGRLYNYDGSLHVYKQDVDKLPELLRHPELPSSKFDIMYPYKSIKALYDDLWHVIKAEESSYYSSFDSSSEYHSQIENPAFRDFAAMYFNRNAKRAGLEDRIEYQTEVLK